MRIPRDRAYIIDLCIDYVNTDCTMRSLAAREGCGKSTIFHRLHDCSLYDEKLYERVKLKIQQNSEIKHIHGGQVTALKWKKSAL